MISDNQFDEIDYIDPTVNSVTTPISLIQPMNKAKIPSPVPFDFASSIFELSPAYNFTPQKIIDQVKCVHANNPIFAGHHFIISCYHIH